MKYDGILFDIDGTLWNANEATASAWNMGAEKWGYKNRITVEDVNRISGTPFEEALKMLFPDFRSEQGELFHELELKVIGAKGGRFYDGVQEGVKNLSESSEIFLISNCPAEYMELFLKLSTTILCKMKKAKGQVH